LELYFKTKFSFLKLLAEFVRICQNFFSGILLGFKFGFKLTLKFLILAKF